MFNVAGVVVWWLRFGIVLGFWLLRLVWRRLVVFWVFVNVVFGFGVVGGLLC